MCVEFSHYLFFNKHFLLRWTFCVIFRDQVCCGTTVSDPNARLVGRHTGLDSVRDEWLQAAGAEQPPPFHSYKPSLPVPHLMSSARPNFPFLSTFPAPGDIRERRQESIFSMESTPGTMLLRTLSRFSFLLWLITRMLLQACDGPVFPSTATLTHIPPWHLEVVGPVREAERISGPEGLSNLLRSTKYEI